MASGYINSGFLKIGENSGIELNGELLEFGGLKNHAGAGAGTSAIKIAQTVTTGTVGALIDLEQKGDVSEANAGLIITHKDALGAGLDMSVKIVGSYVMVKVATDTHDAAALNLQDVNGYERGNYGLGQIKLVNASNVQKIEITDDGTVKADGLFTKIDLSEIATLLKTTFSGTNYLDSEVTVDASLQALDAEIKTVADTVTRAPEFIDAVKLVAGDETLGYVDLGFSADPLNAKNVIVNINGAGAMPMNHARIGSTGASYGYRMGDVNKKRLYFKPVNGVGGDFSGGASGVTQIITTDDIFTADSQA